MLNRNISTCKSLYEQNLSGKYTSRRNKCPELSYKTYGLFLPSVVANDDGYAATFPHPSIRTSRTTTALCRSHSFFLCHYQVHV